MKSNLKIEAIGYGYDQQLSGYSNLFALIGNKDLSDGCKFPKKYWVAEIVGYHPKYKLERKFIKGKVDYVESNSKSSRGVYLNYVLESGLVYEVSKPVSWKNTHRFFATIDDEGNIVEHESYEDAKKAIG